MRLVIATSVWYGFTGLFLIIEDNSGVCNATKFLNKAECKDGGFRWKGLDISGHCFLLVWCNLIILEEAKCYLGWERIKDILRNEEHKRLSVEIPDASDEQGIGCHNCAMHAYWFRMETQLSKCSMLSIFPWRTVCNSVTTMCALHNSWLTPPEGSTVLSRLSPEEFLHLRANYRKHTIIVRVLFCALSFLLLLWDIMIVCTVMYFHMMIEKVIATSLAVIAWFILYRGLYVQPWSPGLPGEGGPFKYVTYKMKTYSNFGDRRGSFRNSHQENHKNEKWSKKDDVPKFMGMPLYALDQKNKAPVRSESKDGDRYIPIIM